MLMNNLLENDGEFVDELMLHGSREPPPDVAGLGAGHGMLHSLTRERSSMMASGVSFVRRAVTRPSPRSVTAIGMMSRTDGPRATEIWPVPRWVRLTERIRKRRPKSG
jgi:hypothetical protein